MSARTSRSGEGARRTVVVAAVAALVLAVVVAGAIPAGATSVRETVHNLSVTGPGEVRSTSETEVCKFCHVPHNAREPQALWGQELSEAIYATPDVTTTVAPEGRAPQPDGASKLCLSCHDGTVALGEIVGLGPTDGTGLSSLVPGQPGYLGTDLSGSHPISIRLPEGPSNAGRAGVRSRQEVVGAGIRLDREGKIQCTTCHDPHRDQYYKEGSVPRFWVRPTVGELCLECHELF